MTSSDVGIVQLGEKNPPLTAPLKICREKRFKLQPWSGCSLVLKMRWDAPQKEGLPGTWWTQALAKRNNDASSAKALRSESTGSSEGTESSVPPVLQLGSAREPRCCKE